MTVDNARQKKSSSLTRGVICLVLSVLFAAAALIVAFFFKKEDAHSAGQSRENVCPTVNITTYKPNGEHYGNELSLEDGYVPARVVIEDESGITVADDPQSRIKVRGNTTAFGAKKPYTINLDSAKNLFAMGGSSKWVLLADYYDPTLMRNAVALKLAHDMGFEAPEYKRAEVWVDGEYKGLYLFTEAVEKGKNRLDIDPRHGDFLIETDSPLREEEGSTYFYSGDFYYRLREPEKVSSAELDMIESRVCDIENVLVSGDYEQVKKELDIPSFVDYYILNELLCPGDFANLSVFFYQKDGILCAGPAWDYDLSQGNLNGYCSEAYETALQTDKPFALYCNYYRYLFRYPEFRKEVSSEYERLNADGVFAFLAGEDDWIVNEKEKYREAIDRNYNLTGVAAGFCGYNRVPSGDYDAELDYLRGWLKARKAWMDGFVKKLNDPGFDVSAGPDFYATTDEGPDATVTIYGYVNPNSGDHFYTGSAVERAVLEAAGWISDGEPFDTPALSDKPVYRLYNEETGLHYYTDDEGERKDLSESGWKDEGIGWYSY